MEYITNPVVRAAREFAIKAHGNQMYGDQPYVYHLDKVSEVLTYFGYTVPELYHTGETLHAGAYLHDTIEDTATNYNDIKKAFDESIAELVYAVTDELGRNRKERHAKTYPKICGFNAATLLKLADRIANAEYSLQTNDSSKLSMYKKEQFEFEKAIRLPDSFNDLWLHLNTLLSQQGIHR